MATESLLIATGELWTPHINVDFKALINVALTLSSIPYYLRDCQKVSLARAKSISRVETETYHGLLMETLFSPYQHVWLRLLWQSSKSVRTKRQLKCEMRYSSMH